MPDLTPLPLLPRSAKYPAPTRATLALPPLSSPFEAGRPAKQGREEGGPSPSLVTVVGKGGECSRRRSSSFCVVERLQAQAEYGGVGGLACRPTLPTHPPTHPLAQRKSLCSCLLPPLPFSFPSGGPRREGERLWASVGEGKRELSIAASSSSSSSSSSSGAGEEGG